MVHQLHQRSPALLRERTATFVEGFPATTEAAALPNYQAITAEYAASQREHNDQKTRDWLHPLLSRLEAHSVLDAGCGVGEMVTALLRLGYDAHGFDLLENVPRWKEKSLPADRFVVTDPDQLILPYHDGVFDAAVSFGVIEHIGTTDGNATRRPDYHDRRRQWTRELFRVVRPGGHMLLAGPNKGFPIDVAHGLDAAASGIERALSRAIGASIHRSWGENFLWSYGDVDRYLEGLPYSMMALSVDGLVNFSRVPSAVRPIVRAYVARLPRPLRRTGFNPWVAALVRREF